MAYFDPARKAKNFPSLCLGLMLKCAKSSNVRGTNSIDPIAGSDHIMGGNLWLLSPKFRRRYRKYVAINTVPNTSRSPPVDFSISMMLIFFTSFRYLDTKKRACNFDANWSRPISYTNTQDASWPSEGRGLKPRIAHTLDMIRYGIFTCAQKLTRWPA